MACFGWFFRRRRKADGELTAWKGTTTSRGAGYHVQELQDKRRYLAESDYFLPKDRGEAIRHLGDLLKQAGLQTVETQQIVIPVGEWGGRVGSMLKRDFLTVMHTLQSLYCTRGALSPTEYERMVQEAASEWESLQACYTFFAVSGRRGLA